MKHLRLIIIFVIILFLFKNQENSFHLSDAQNQESNQKIVTILKGSASPEVDVTKLSQKQWYMPNPITINMNDTVKWVNNDTESHTITSGIGGGLDSLLTGAKGKPNGLFDSGLFKSGTSYSLKFNKTGTFNYYCTIHPWMEGTILVKNTSMNIPNYPVDQYGNKIEKFPLYNLTNDKKTEVGISWSPGSIKTKEPISFVLEFFKMPENDRLHLWPYNFIIIQNEKEIHRSNGFAEFGAGVQNYIFNTPGKTTIKIEESQNPSSFIQFETIVYKNPTDDHGNMKGMSSQSSQSSSSIISPLLLVYLVYVVVIGIPTAAATMVILIKKKKI